MRPRIRSVKPEMWADEKVCQLSRDARLLLLGLITLADDEGRFRARRSEILGYLFPGDDDAPALVDGWVSEIKEQGLVLFYLIEGTPYGAFRNWARHQKINRPTPSLLPPPPDPKTVRANRTKTHGVSRENAGSQTGRNGESSRSAHSSTRGCAFRSDPDQIPSLKANGSKLTAAQKIEVLSERLAAHICRNDDKATPTPFSDRWLRDMRLLVADRGGDVDAYLEVERIIDWCQADSFWCSNVLSPTKLRGQFTQLMLKAAAKPSLHAVGETKTDYSIYDRAAGL